ncbi:hypothetical protein GBA52_006066 [Prunus armeniaca]|nr:hypothetical protein GBA52_006066 [Prunus armeniaca]
MKSLVLQVLLLRNIFARKKIFHKPHPNPKTSAPPHPPPKLATTEKEKKKIFHKPHPNESRTLTQQPSRPSPPPNKPMIPFIQSHLICLKLKTSTKAQTN